MSSIPLSVLEKGKLEVREDDLRREQSLKQFREWINKHQFIRNFQIYDECLLSFLRAQKYEMNHAFDAFEKYFLFTKKRSDWYDYRGAKLQKALDLYDDGCIKVLKQRDSEGRRIVLMHNNIDTDKYNVDDIFRLNMLIFLTLSIEEDTQFCGIVLINDYSNVNFKLFTMFSIALVYDLAMVLKVAPLRMKNITFVGLPSFGVQFLNGFKIGLPAKIKEQLSVMGSRDELWKHYDKASFTKDFDGEVDEREAIDYFREIIDEKLEMIQNIVGSFDVDVIKAAHVKEVQETIGSFRKLEID